MARGCAAWMVGDEKQRLDVNRIELEAALGGRPGLSDLEPPHKGVDPDPEPVDLKGLGGKEVTCRLVGTDICQFLRAREQIRRLAFHDREDREPAPAILAARRGVFRSMQP
jgi:hypothetical protein